jgi:hypothetical protein
MRSFLIALNFFFFSCGGNAPEYISIEGTEKTLAYVYWDKRGKAGLLDTSFKIILPAQFDYIEGRQRENLILVDSGGHRINCGDCVGYDFKKIGLVNTKGQILFRPQFDELIVADNAALVKVDSLFGFIDGNGRWLLKPMFKKAQPFYKGTAIVEDSGVYKLINKQGLLVTKQLFDTVWSFKNNVAVVEKKGKLGFVNYRGRMILPLDNYRGIGEYNWYFGVFKKGEKWFIIDTVGSLPIKEGFDQVEIHGDVDSTLAVGLQKGKKVRVRLR